MIKVAFSHSEIRKWKSEIRKWINKEFKPLNGVCICLFVIFNIALYRDPLIVLLGRMKRSSVHTPWFCYCPSRKYINNSLHLGRKSNMLGYLSTDIIVSRSEQLSERELKGKL